MDFSTLNKPGLYILKAGGITTREFRIDENIWDPSIEKVMNFFYCERCGQLIPGIHDECHKDFFMTAMGERVTINGGWHDAADLTHKWENQTAVYAMLRLAESLKKRGASKELIDRILEEASWGLDYVMKLSFRNGARGSGGAMSDWLNGIIGDFDDVTHDVSIDKTSRFSLFSIASAVEAAGARMLKESDPVRAEKCAKMALEDWNYAQNNATGNGSEYMRLNVTSLGAWSSIEMYRLTGKMQYAEKAVEYAKILCSSQRLTRLEGCELPLTGMLKNAPGGKGNFFSEGHRGDLHSWIAAAIESLCEALPNHPDWINWYSFLTIYSEYFQKPLCQLNAPYSFLPGTVMNLNQARAQASSRNQDKPSNEEYITNGVSIGGGWYVRRILSDPGHFGVLLAQTKMLSSAAYLRNDAGLRDLAAQQLYWIVGRNPFCQSMMIGEGYDFPPYHAYSGNFMVGALPVGIKFRNPLDIPFMPTQTCWAYKEVWVHPAYLWLWVLADIYAAPAGSTESGIRHDLKLDSRKSSDGKIIITAETKNFKKLTLRAFNLNSDGIEKSVRNNKTVWECTKLKDNEPWVAVVVPDGNLSLRKEIVE